MLFFLRRSLQQKEKNKFSSNCNDFLTFKLFVFEAPWPNFYAEFCVHEPRKKEREKEQILHQFNENVDSEHSFSKNKIVCCFKMAYYGYSHKNMKSLFKKNFMLMLWIQNTKSRKRLPLTSLLGTPEDVCDGILQHAYKKTTLTVCLWLF